MKKYTLGFVFNDSLKRVALMEKKRPDWQKGRLNGVGGKIEPGESSIACIVREVREESGLESKSRDWTHIALLKGLDWKMDVYAYSHKGKESAVHTLTDEKVRWFDVMRLPRTALANVPWLVNLSKDKLLNNEFRECIVTYR